MTSEYWVMKVLISKDSKMHDREVELATKDPHIMAALASGALAFVGGELVEPIAYYADDEVARARAVAEHARTGVVHKVTLSMDVTAS